MSKKVLGNTKQGLLFVVSAPAGTGKSTLVDMLLEEFSGEVTESCSSTTRQPRSGEIAGKHYDFLTIAEFEQKVAAGEFLESAKVFGNYYGTRKDEVNTLLRHGKHVILVIDTQGAMKLKEHVPTILIFIRPPSMEELERRLFKRKTETQDHIRERLEWARQEIALAPQYDYEIINDDLQVTYQILRSILIAEEHKRRQ